ncbi:EAL domain-containing protein [Aeromonas sp. 603696]|uniref:EAL domain-containing protein n=1 Tax=Aeromonas sp. 603696 TaxID=2712049 RepID=UPI003BA3C9F7
MKILNCNRLYLEKPRHYHLAVFFASIALMLTATYLLFSYEKKSISLESERYTRRTVVEIDKIFNEVERGIDEIFKSRETTLDCSSSINLLMDAATRNPYTMMYYVIDKSGGVCASYKYNSDYVASISKLMMSIDLNKNGLYLEEFMNRPVFLLVRSHQGVSVVGFVDIRYITDLIVDHNDMSEAISYRLTIDSQYDAQSLGSFDLVVPPNDKLTVQSRSDKYGFGVAAYMKSDAYVMMKFLKEYGWGVVIIIGASFVLLMMFNLWIDKFDFIGDDIRKGIIHNEFLPYIQPIVDSSTYEVVGGEVLVRWQHPVYGLIGPAQFVEAAERSGDIILITEQLMDMVSARFSASDVFVSSHFTINFNVTLSQLISPDLVQTCSHFLSAFEGNARPQLCLEIVERGMLDDHTELQMITAFKRLHSKGIRFAVDDFGTGYSSLRHVYSSYIDAIKIDRLFVKDIDSNKMAYEIVMNIIDLASRIGAKVVAEGIEKPMQAKILSKMGVDCFQGYLYGKPMPMDAFITSFMSKECRHEAVST